MFRECDALRRCRRRHHHHHLPHRMWFRWDVNSLVNFYECLIYYLLCWHQDVCLIQCLFNRLFFDGIGIIIAVILRVFVKICLFLLRRWWWSLFKLLRIHRWLTIVITVTFRRLLSNRKNTGWLFWMTNEFGLIFKKEDWVKWEN